MPTHPLKMPKFGIFWFLCVFPPTICPHTHGWPIHDLRALFNDCVGGGHFAIYIVLFDRYKRITAGRLRKQQIMLREMREKVVKNTKSALSRVSSMEGVKRTVTRVASSDMVKRVVTRVASRDTRDHTE